MNEDFWSLRESWKTLHLKSGHYRLINSKLTRATAIWATSRKLKVFSFKLADCTTDVVANCCSQTLPCFRSPLTSGYHASTGNAAHGGLWERSLSLETRHQCSGRLASASLCWSRNRFIYADAESSVNEVNPSVKLLHQRISLLLDALGDLGIWNYCNACKETKTVRNSC